MILLQDMEISIKNLASYFILILILLTVLILIVKGIGKKKKDDKNKSIFSWIEMKDVLYWLFIVCLMTISILTFKYSDNESAVDHWSFAGTVVSIILAVVAIGFTLFQTIASNLSSQKIEVAADKIEKASIGLDTAELTEAGNIINAVSNKILDHNERLMEQVHDLNEEIKNFKTEQTTHYERMSQFLNSYEYDEEAQRDHLINLTKDNFMESFLNLIPRFHRFYLYSLNRFTEEDIPITDEILQDFTIEHSERLDDQVSEDDRTYRAGANLGALLALRSYLKFFDGIRIDNYRLNIKPELKDLLNEEGAKSLLNDSPDSMKFLVDFIQENK